MLSLRGDLLLIVVSLGRDAIQCFLKLVSPAKHPRLPAQQTHSLSLWCGQRPPACSVWNETRYYDIITDHVTIFLVPRAFVEKEMVRSVLYRLDVVLLSDGVTEKQVQVVLLDLIFSRAA